MSRPNKRTYSEMNVAAEGGRRFSIQDSYYLNEHLSDMTILVGKRKFPAHKVILANKSSYFKNLIIKNPNKTEWVMRGRSTTPKIMRIFLKYFYTGAIIMPSDHQMILQLLKLSRQFKLREFSSALLSKFDVVLDTKNVFFFLNGANTNGLDGLRNVCHLLVDAHPLEILSSDDFIVLTQKSLIQLLKRDSFVAPDIEIFKSVAKWCEYNNNSDDEVLECIRFSALGVSEITSIVGLTNLLNSDRIVKLISESNGECSTLLCVDENVANGAQLMSQLDTVGLLSGNRNSEKSVHHMIDDRSGIIVRLRKPYFINQIRMMLYDLDDRACSYYIETSLDQINWHMILDYTRYWCRSVQNLHFDKHIAQYIKIVGTRTSVGDDFRLVFFEAFYRNEIPEVIDGIIRPETNVATPENGARVAQGINPEGLLDGNPETVTYHDIGDSRPIVVQLAQPYIISSMELLLFGDIMYKYFIETSIDGTDWEIAVDRSNEECTSLQDLRFPERVVVFVKITGTYSFYPVQQFGCSHFRCPSDDSDRITERDAPELPLFPNL